jgi:hypothetical protein
MLRVKWQQDTHYSLNELEELWPEIGTCWDRDGCAAEIERVAKGEYNLYFTSDYDNILTAYCWHVPKHSRFVYQGEREMMGANPNRDLLWFEFIMDPVPRWRGVDERDYMEGVMKVSLRVRGNDDSYWELEASP